MMRLSIREKRAVILAASLLALFFLLQLGAFPLLETRKQLQRLALVREAALEEIRSLAGEYEALRRHARDLQAVLAARPGNFSLFSLLEQEAGRAGVKEHVKSLKPFDSATAGPYRESLVEMKLEGIGLEKLVDYLQRIEKPAQAIRLKRVTIRRNTGEPGRLEAVLQVTTYQ